jgi:hypothetical protein
MGLRAVFAAALPGIFEAAGEAAVFTPSVGAAVPCFVFIDFDVDLQPSGMEAQVWERGTTIEALLSVILKVPDRGETFTVAGRGYTVKSIAANDGLSVKCVVA